MISIIIPVYNVEKYLAECLESILAQTYTDFEVILIDDGSPDSSGIICDAYAQKDNRIHVIHQSNAGVSTARNNGIEYATGEWITFVDSDDWLDPDFLASFKLSDDIDLSVTGLRYMRYPERTVMKTWIFEEKNISLIKDVEDIARNNLLEYGTVCCKAYKKLILNKHNLRFDKNISYHEDHLLFLQYIQNIDKVALHKAVGYNYRIPLSGQSLSSKTHPWDKLDKSGEAMIKELISIPYYKHLPLWYQQKISTFCVEPKISACRYVFMSQLTADEKRKAFRLIKETSSFVEKYYAPIGFRNKLQKLCFELGYYPSKVYFDLISLSKKLR